MEEVRIGIQQVINNLQKMEITATYNNCLQMAAALQDLANIRDRIGEIEKEMKKLEAQTAKAAQPAVTIENGSNMPAQVVAPVGEIQPVKVVPVKEVKNDGK